MLGIELIYMGADKEKFFVEAQDEYIKRLSAYCNFTKKSIKEEYLPEKASEKEVTNTLDREGDKILSATDARSYKIALCIEGKQLSSEELAKVFADITDKGYSKCAFIIGSSEGLSEKVKISADLKLSMSKMTFPHRLARVMLLEQIYRALSILKGTKYHK